MDSLSCCPTKQQFDDFLRIRDSGVTNMIDFRTVCEYSKTGLTNAICGFIISNFEYLCKKYEVD